MRNNIFYMDLTDYCYELGNVSVNLFAFNEISKLKEKYTCVEECGICLIQLIPVAEIKKGDVRVYHSICDGVVSFSRKKQDGYIKVAVRKIEVVEKSKCLTIDLDTDF